MSSFPPIDSEDFAVSFTTPISKEVWNPVMLELVTRIRAQEDVQADFQTLIIAGTAGALTIIQQNVGPQLTTVEGRFDVLNQEIVDAQEALATLIGSGVASGNVTLEEIEGLISRDVQSAVTELLNMVVVNKTAITDTVTELEEEVSSNIGVAGNIGASLRRLGILYNSGLQVTKTGHAAVTNAILPNNYQVVGTIHIAGDNAVVVSQTDNTVINQSNYIADDVTIVDQIYLNTLEIAPSVTFTVDGTVQIVSF